MARTHLAALAMISAACVAIVVGLGVEIIRVAGSSMSPTLNNGDLILIVRRRSFVRLRRNEIVVAQVAKGSNLIVKRIIGLPGEWMTNGVCFESAGTARTARTGEVAPFAELQIPAYQYFLSADNPERGLDSRVFGLIAYEDIVGRVVFKLWPAIRPL